MNISKAEQRTLHVLVRGSAIFVEKDDKGKVIAVNCITREGWTLEDCTVNVFSKMRRRKLIASSNREPYRATFYDRKAVRGQVDNRS